MGTITLLDASQTSLLPDPNFLGTMSTKHFFVTLFLNNLVICLVLQSQYFYDPKKGQNFEDAAGQIQNCIKSLGCILNFYQSCLQSVKLQSCILLEQDLIDETDDDI